MCGRKKPKPVPQDEIIIDNGYQAKSTSCSPIPQSYPALSKYYNAPPPRDHGRGCVMEIALLEKHSDHCKHNKIENPNSNPADDKHGSYYVVGRVAYPSCVKTCGKKTILELVPNQQASVLSSMSYKSNSSYAPSQYEVDVNGGCGFEVGPFESMVDQVISPIQRRSLSTNRTPSRYALSPCNNCTVCQREAGCCKCDVAGLSRIPEEFCQCPNGEIMVTSGSINEEQLVEGIGSQTATSRSQSRTSKIFSATRQRSNSITNAASKVASSLKCMSKHLHPGVSFAKTLTHTCGGSRSGSFFSREPSRQYSAIERERSELSAKSRTKSCAMSRTQVKDPSDIKQNMSSPVIDMEPSNESHELSAKSRTFSAALSRTQVKDVSDLDTEMSASLTAQLPEESNSESAKPRISRQFGSVSGQPKIIIHSSSAEQDTLTQEEEEEAKSRNRLSFRKSKDKKSSEISVAEHTCFPLDEDSDTPQVAEKNITETPGFDVVGQRTSTRQCLTIPNIESANIKSRSSIVTADKVGHEPSTRQSLNIPNTESANIKSRSSIARVSTSQAREPTSSVSREVSALYGMPIPTAASSGRVSQVPSRQSRISRNTSSIAETDDRRISQVASRHSRTSRSSYTPTIAENGEDPEDSVSNLPARNSTVVESQAPSHNAVTGAISRHASLSRSSRISRNDSSRTGGSAVTAIDSSESRQSVSRRTRSNITNRPGSFSPTRQSSDNEDIELSNSDENANTTD